MRRIKKILFTTLFMTACSSEQQVQINSEHISNEELYKQLSEKLPELKGKLTTTDSGILIEGNNLQVSQLLSAAEKIDIEPSHFFLTISNQAPNTKSTSNNSLRLNIQKGHSISLSHQMLSSAPWSDYRSFNNYDLLTASLGHDMNLSLTLSNARNNKARSFNASFIIEPNKWTQLYGNVDKDGIRTYKTHSEQLWVKLAVP